MEKLSVPQRKMLLQRELPFRESVLFEGVVCCDCDNGSSSLESNPSFCTDNRIARMNTTSDAPRRGNLFERSDGAKWMFEQCSVETDKLPSDEMECQPLATIFGDWCWKGIVRQPFVGNERFTSANRRTQMPRLTEYGGRLCSSETP